MRPVELLADGARAIEAGRLDYRIEPETADEFGSLVEGFNSMAGGLAAGQRKLKRSQADLRRTNVEVDGRRRYTETILEWIATGVVSIGSDGRVSTVNRAAARLLGLAPAVIGLPAEKVFGRADFRPLADVLRGLTTRGDQPPQEVALERDGREWHLVVAATNLQSDADSGGGAVHGRRQWPGILDADRDKLFMPYYSTKQRGSDLGLAIVRRIIIEHGGNIEVGENGERGTRFTVELPCRSEVASGSGS